MTKILYFDRAELDNRIAARSRHATRKYGFDALLLFSQESLNCGDG
jgi:hypothetical protein